MDLEEIIEKARILTEQEKNKYLAKIKGWIN